MLIIKTEVPIETPKPASVFFNASLYNRYALEVTCLNCPVDYSVYVLISPVCVEQIIRKMCFTW